jgi:hypothetical protein
VGENYICVILEVVIFLERFGSIERMMVLIVDRFKIGVAPHKHSRIVQDFLVEQATGIKKSGRWRVWGCI